MTSRLRGFYSLVGAAFIYATFGVLIRYLTPMFGDNFQVAVRFFLAAIIIAAFNLYRKKSIKLSKQVLLKIFALGVASFSVVLLFTFSVINTKIANTVFLLYAGSLSSSFLIGTFILKEKLTMVKIAAIILAILGVAMYSNAFLAVSSGIITGLASGIFDGIQNSIRKTLMDIDRNVVLEYSFVLGTVFAIISTLISGEQVIKSISLMPVIIIIFYAILLLTLGNLLLYGFQHFDVNVGTVILSMELLFATIFGFILFKEVPSTKELIGGVLIFIASILSGVDTKQLLFRFQKDQQT